MRPSSMRLGLILLALIGTAGELAAQSSMFGTRGVGFPGRWLGARARATGGSFGIFDGTSALNPAAMSSVPKLTVGFVATPSWRKWETPAGTAKITESRYPLVGLVAPVPRTPLWFGIGFASYADQDYRLFHRDTVQVNQTTVEVFDTLQSLGGLNEIRFALGFDRGRGTSLGASIHLLTGSDRLDARRSFGDSSYISIRQSAEVAYSGVGFTVGAIQRVTRGLRIGAVVRSDGNLKVEQDSLRKATHLDLPYTFAGGIELSFNPKLSVAGQAIYRTWSAVNSDLIAAGGIGAENTLDISLGAEYRPYPRRPNISPIRLGARYAQLPFPLNAGGHPEEFAIAGGTGVRFARDKAGIDVSLEYAWRSQGSDYKERALTLTLGLSLVP